MIEIKKLPYNFEALKPVIGSDTLFFHYDKHYVGYVARANELMPPKWRQKSLPDIISLSQKQEDKTLFNQVAQIWNHEFFFQGLSLDPKDKEISDRLLELIQIYFQNVENLKCELIRAAMSCFGSGWVWLVLEGNDLKIYVTSNAETLCDLDGCRPLWILDVWEHAYYLNYQNRRIDYATETVNQAINWRFVSNNLSV